MIEWLRNWWKKVTTRPCDSCGQAVRVSEYRETGNSRREGLLAGIAVELACPRCGYTFWIRK